MLRTAARRFSAAASPPSSKVVPTLKLNSGYTMPLIGFGIWKIPTSSAGESVYQAIKSGYRLIDGAYDYANSREAGLGAQAAIKDGLVSREELFITSKLWNNYHRADHVIEQARAENDAWGLGYLDAFLVHFPISLKYISPDKIKYPCWWKDGERKVWNDLDPVPMSETWAAMEKLVLNTPTPPITSSSPSSTTAAAAGGGGGGGGDGRQPGFVRSIGVSNFHTQLLYDLLSYSRIKPSILQIEHHPYLTSQSLVTMAQENGLAVTAYSTFGPASFVEMDHPLAKTATPLLSHPVVVGIATAHGKTPAQVLLRWCTQRNVAVIPKSNKPERAVQNLDSCSFDMTKEELDAISGLDCGMRFNDPGVLGKPIRIWV